MPSCDFVGWRQCTSEAVFEFASGEGDSGRSAVHSCDEHLGRMIPVGRAVTVHPVGMLAWTEIPQMQPELEVYT